MIYHGTGKYQCYCAKHSGISELLNDKNNICNDYVNMIYYGKILGNTATILVIVFNIASRKAVIKLIERIGLWT